MFDPHTVRDSSIQTRKQLSERGRSGNFRIFKMFYYFRGKGMLSMLCMTSVPEKERQSMSCEGEYEHFPNNTLYKIKIETPF